MFILTVFCKLERKPQHSERERAKEKLNKFYASLVSGTLLMFILTVFISQDSLMDRDSPERDQKKESERTDEMLKVKGRRNSKGFTINWCSLK
jgi:hypothetical protein